MVLVNGHVEAADKFVTKGVKKGDGHQSEERFGLANAAFLGRLHLVEHVLQRLTREPVALTLLSNNTFVGLLHGGGGLAGR